MKKLLAIVLALATLLCCVPAMAEEEAKIITVGKQFDYNGKTFLEGQSIENNYYTDVCYEVAGVKFEFAWILADDDQKVSLAVASGEMPDVMEVDLTAYNMLLDGDSRCRQPCASVLPLTRCLNISISGIPSARIFLWLQMASLLRSTL